MLILTRDSLAYHMLDMVERGILGFLGVLDGLIYRLVSMVFELFYALANVQLLNNEMYEAISNKVYIFIGVIALFTLSFSLLKVMVNPDEVGKTTIKSFKTLVTSIILLILMPTIFQYAFSFQNAIMKDDVIGKIFQININQTDEKNSNDDSMGEMCDFEDGETKNFNIGVEGVEAIPNELSVSKKQCEANYITMSVLEAFITPYDYNVENNSGTPWSEARKYMIYTGNFKYVSTYVDQMLDSTENDKSITYTFLVSTLAGAFLIYIILSFCIDLGVRAAKLAFYQLIAPIPILMRLIPGKEGQFDKWTKSVISTFLEIFVRLIIINFVVFICSNIFDIIDNTSSFGTVGVIGKAILAIGLLMFGKQAPNLLKDVIGIDGGNLSLKIKDKLTGTPVVGKAFGTAYNTANKFKGAAQGAITGGIGAGWTAARNKGKFTDGFKYGAAVGIRKGGNQFESQRQGYYNEMGFEGTAGYLGGRNKLEEVAENVKNKSAKQSKENYKKWVEDYETKDPMFLQLQAQNMERIRNEKQNLKDSLEKQRDIQAKGYYDEENRIKAMQENAKLQYDNAQQKIQDLTSKIQSSSYYDGEELIGYTDSQKQQMMQEIEKLSKVSYDAEKYENMLAANAMARDDDDEVKALNEAIEDTEKYLSSNSETLSKAAHDAARTTQKNNDARYKNIVEAVEKIENRDKINEQVKSQKGQADLEIMKKAFQAANKDK